MLCYLIVTLCYTSVSHISRTFGRHVIGMCGYDILLCKVMQSSEYRSQITFQAVLGQRRRNLAPSAWLGLAL